jgi:predicted TIM-barrel fold metal-dependent hydrolase
MVHPGRDAGRVRSLVREAVEVHGFCGIKVHRYDARITREVCEVAERFRLPVLYDVMGEAWSMNLVASEYRAVRFIVPHLGSFADDWRAHLGLIDVMVRHTNVYADTSGVRRFDYLVEAVRRAGPAKLLFGSDGPWLHPGLELAKIRALGLTPSDESRVLGESWRRLVHSPLSPGGSGAFFSPDSTRMNPQPSPGAKLPSPR